MARKSGPEIEKEIYCFEDKGGRKLGLIFEFTASLARVVANNPQLVFPFKRYAIGKVWRYERPQSSRYREFVQADVDIVGSPSMDCEAELMCLTCDVLKALELPNYRIHLNNRKILEAQATVANIKDEHVPDALRALDKFFKIGRDGVQNEFLSRGMSLDDFDRFMDLIYAAEDSLPNADNEDNNPDSRYANRLRLEMTRKALESSAKGIEGADELTRILDLGDQLGFGERILFDPFLVRGLDYYTGPIFEAKVLSENMGSFAGGGRYDRLVELYGGRPAGAVGISFGVERVVDILSQRGVASEPISRVFVAYISHEMKVPAMRLADRLRRARIPTDFELSERRFIDQLNYAHKRQFPYVVIVGPDELASSQYKLKNMTARTEQTMTADELVAVLSQSVGCVRLRLP